MAALTIQRPSILGSTITMASAAADGDTVAPGAPGSKTMLLVTNGSGSEITVTVARAGTQYGQANPDVPVTVADGATRLIGPIPSEFSGSTGTVAVTYSSATTVTIAAIQA